MSSINFEITQVRHPELAPISELVQRWIAEHKRKKYIDVLTLVRDLTGEVSPVDVVKFLNAIEESGEVDVEFRVVSPSNQLVDESFGSPEDVPYELVDDLGRPFVVDRTRIIPVYRVR